MQSGKAMQSASVRAVLRGKGKSLHLNMSGLSTAAAVSRAATPAHADALQAPPPSAAGRQRPCVAALHPPSLRPAEPSYGLRPPRFLGLCWGVGLLFYKTNMKFARSDLLARRSKSRDLKCRLHSDGHPNAAETLTSPPRHHHGSEPCTVSAHISQVTTITNSCS